MTRAGRLSRRAFLTGVTASAVAGALSRVPYGGRAVFKIPWPLGTLDPHDLYDPTAMLFATAVADPLYGVDASGRAYPALAAALPEPAAGGMRVRLREGLRTASGAVLKRDDVIWSLRRARRLGARGLLGAYGEAKPDPSAQAALLIPDADAAVALALASPLASILSRRSTPTAPDGTGAFRAVLSRGRLELRRNLHAARGPALLEAIDVESVPDIAAGLRAFEAGDSDIGWLGAGLHRPRPDAAALSGPSVALVVLRTGLDAGTWAAPGIAQQLADAVPADAVVQLGVFKRPNATESTRWGGPPSELFVSSDCPQLSEVASVVASRLSQPGHLLTVRKLPRPTLDELRHSRRFALLLDMVSRARTSELVDPFVLLAAADPRLASRPPRLTDSDVRKVTRTLTLGVVGDLVIKGAHARDLSGGWDLGGLWRKSVWQKARGA